MNKGKKILFLFVTVCSLLVTPLADAQSTLALQERCAESATKLVSENPSKLVSEFHYNGKLNQCFVMIKYKDIRKKIMLNLTNVFENKQVGLYISEDYEKKPVICIVGNNECNSLSEFETLIKPYMEE